MLRGLLSVSDGTTHAKHLLQLELDGALELLNLGCHALIVGKETRELTGLVQTRTQETGDLTDDGLRGEESIILLGCLDVRSCSLHARQ